MKTHWNQSAGNVFHHIYQYLGWLGSGSSQPPVEAFGRNLLSDMLIPCQPTLLLSSDHPHEISQGLHKMQLLVRFEKSEIFSAPDWLLTIH